MSAKKATKAVDDICARCGHPQGDHWVLNHANGPYVSGDVLICPTSVFTPRQP